MPSYRSSSSDLRQSLGRGLRSMLRYALVFALGALAVIALGDVLYSSTLGPLRPWHTAHLQHEFTASQAHGGYGFTQYRAQEALLFAEVQELRRSHFNASLDSAISRYAPDGGPYRKRVAGDWNRSYVLQAAPERGVALLVHGLSDSPYSLRPLALALQTAGITVYGLRLPGHGTIPAGLDAADWQDWLAAVDITARELRRDHPNVPYWFVGYSTGATLGIKHASDALAAGRSDLVPQRLFLLSPAVGVSPLARLSNVQRLISRFGIAAKARWTNVDLEIDPYKYTSFAKNAGAQVAALCRVLDNDLRSMDGAGSIGRLPPVTTFQSLADATVVVTDLPRVLYGRLQGGNSELMLFDLNRRKELERFLTFSPKVVGAAFEKAPRRDYRFMLVSNDQGSPSVAVNTFEPAQSRPSVQPVPYVWPDNVYSLSHVAVPFPMDDPLYGLHAKPYDDGLPSLGMLALRGEKGAFAMAPADQLRMRSNPFFGLMRDHILAAIAAGTPTP